MRKGWLLSALTVMFCSSTLFHAQAAVTGTWELAEDGKGWRYYYSVNNYAEDEWIEEDGKEYYIDSRGYMKTGWVTNKEDGNKYYLGEDGAKCYNMMTADNVYVDDQGLVIQSYEKYRKTIKKQLLSILKSKEYKNSTVQSAGFLFEDFNEDGYRDLAVLDKVTDSERVLYVAIWDSEAEALKTQAEFDMADQTKHSWLYRNQKDDKTCLEIYEADGNGWDYFEMDHGRRQFEHIWHFEVKKDEWNEPEYIVNGDIVDETEWTEQFLYAEQSGTGEPYQQVYSLTEAVIGLTVDQPPEDVGLWRG